MLQSRGLFSSRIYSIKGVNEASTTFFVVCLHVVWMFIQTIGFVLEKRNRQVCGSCRAYGMLDRTYQNLEMSF